MASRAWGSTPTRWKSRRPELNDGRHKAGPTEPPCNGWGAGFIPAYFNLIDSDYLPLEARDAWEAYLAMRAGKSNYFTLLSEIDQRSRDGGAPATIAESLLLEKLLGEHSAAVHRFSAAMAAVTDPDAREALIRAIKERVQN